jgi:hypothetical protein
MNSLLFYLEASEIATVPTMSTTSVPDIERKRKKDRDRGLRWLIAISSIGVAGYAIVRFLFFFPPTEGHFSERLFLLQVHASGGAVALLTGP